LLQALYIFTCIPKFYRLRGWLRLSQIPDEIVLAFALDVEVFETPFLQSLSDDP